MNSIAIGLNPSSQISPLLLSVYVYSPRVYLLLSVSPQTIVTENKCQNEKKKLNLNHQLPSTESVWTSEATSSDERVI